MNLATWLVERLEIFHQLIVVVDASIRDLSAKFVTDTPKSLPKGMGGLIHEHVETEVADWNRFKNRRQVGRDARPPGGIKAPWTKARRT